MQSKTIEQWCQETEYYAAFYYERYAQTLYNPRFTKELSQYYCDISKNNMDLREVLYHIKTYGKLYAPADCSACKNNNINHGPKLKKTYHKYKKWILAYQGNHISEKL